MEARIEGAMILSQAFNYKEMIASASIGITPNS